MLSAALAAHAAAIDSVPRREAGLLRVVHAPVQGLRREAWRSHAVAVGAASADAGANVALGAFMTNDTRNALGPLGTRHPKAEASHAKRMAVLYATREGQTRHIAEHVAARVRAWGFAVDLEDVAHLPLGFTLANHAGAILAASVHLGEHEHRMVTFVKHRVRRRQADHPRGDRASAARRSAHSALVTCRVPDES